MQFIEIAGRRYAQFERLRQADALVHAYSTRSLDVTLTRGEQGDADRRTMTEDWGLRADRLRHCHQVHGSTLAMVERAEAAGRLPHCDGAITAVPGVPLMTFSADCPLVLVHDPVRRAVGMVHASWRCTVAGATRRLVKLMKEQFSSRAAELLAGIGPSAGPCCYEVQQDVYDAAAALPDREPCFSRRDGRMYFDLWEANRRQLMAAGVRAAHIETAELCTMCRTDLFYSYRREGETCGHFALLAAIAER